MKRRGFTILELVLASAIATLVVLGAFAVFTAMNKSDRRLAAQYAHVSEIERTRRAFLNTFTSLVMSDRPMARRNNSESTARATPVTPKPGSADASATGDAGGSKSDPPAVRPPPPRIVLGVGDSTDFFGQSMQRLEVVLSRTPVPAKTSSVEYKPINDSHLVSNKDTPRNNTATDGGSQAIRGAFILRSQEEPPAFDARRDSVNVQELWWVPLPPPAEEGDETERPLAATAGNPTRLLTDIVQCRWQFFQKDEWHDALEVTWSNDLPAYVKVTIELANGNRTEWLLEVDFTTGAEVTVSGLDSGADPNADVTGTNANGLPSKGRTTGTSTIKGSLSNQQTQTSKLIRVSPKGEQN